MMPTAFAVGKLFTILASCHAVYTENHTGDIGCLLRCQEQERIGDILRLTQPTERNPGDHRIDNLLGDSFHHIRFRDAGSYRIDTDTFGA